MELKARMAPQMSSLLYIITGCGMGYMAALQHPKALGDVVEASIGAVFVDSGCDLNATYPVRPTALTILSFLSFWCLQPHIIALVRCGPSTLCSSQGKRFTALIISGMVHGAQMLLLCF